MIYWITPTVQMLACINIITYDLFFCVTTYVTLNIVVDYILEFFYDL